VTLLFQYLCPPAQAEFRLLLTAGCLAFQPISLLIGRTKLPASACSIVTQAAIICACRNLSYWLVVIIAINPSLSEAASKAFQINNRTATHWRARTLPQRTPNPERVLSRNLSLFPESSLATVPGSGSSWPRPLLRSDLSVRHRSKENGNLTATKV
jgi:hypothetical protein